MVLAVMQILPVKNQQPDHQKPMDKNRIRKAKTFGKILADVMNKTAPRVSG
ncbi:MAG TPA: hypothetical protein PKA10_08880 [Selenomonadales bacterium]|nr:hypothetical protein [Selenomonadales bacterium]